MFKRFHRDKNALESPKPLPKPPSKSPTFPQEPIRTLTTTRRNTSLSENSLRLVPGRTNLSTFDPLLQSSPSGDADARLKLRAKDRRADPLGLQVIYAPDNPPTIDIIFVHGLGGTSQQTWSKNRDPELFWPREWLPFEPDICTARVLSFGYNANFSAVGSNMFNISDFAKELLFGMKFGMDKDSRLLELGKVPIIFVAHSMGGLVVKKAYILGQNDMHYKDIVRSMSSILFLSTPHRGTNLADVLNRILTASVFNHSPKQYIAELKNNSPTLQEINEQFRHIASSLQIISFFETLPTVIGPKKMMVLEKDSSILGYPGEISKPLNADHHDVCKFSSQQDSNYISVRDVLSSLVGRFRRKAEDVVQDTSDALQEDLRKTEKLLAISEAPDEDYEFFSGRRMAGSCEWLPQNEKFRNWINSTSGTPQMLWLRGLPGTGKSILSSFVIGHLEELEIDCQFFFFRFGDQRKTSLNVFLRSFAYQIARDNPEYRHKLAKLADEGVNVEKAESRLVWQRLFVSTLFKMELVKPLYWVIDALDESDSPSTLLNLFSAISNSGLPIRILFVSRKNQSLVMSFERLATTIPLETMEAQDSIKDLELYVDKEIEFMRGSLEIKQHVAKTLLEKAGGNFLWVHLVLEEIMQCHTEDDIEQALTELPPDLEPLYARMEAALSKNARPADQELAMTILTWAACSRRALTLPELSQALTPEYKPVLDLQHTINQACGEFVVIDAKSNVNMIHQTARDYLIQTPGLRFSITPPEAHYLMFKKCLSHLIERKLRARPDQSSFQPFYLYAATSWPFHLHLSSAYKDQAMVIMLAKFFSGPALLTWVNALAHAKQLRVLVLASKRLGTFLERRGRIDAEKSPTTHCIREKEIIESWAIDLVKIIGKFGGHLLSHPKTIYKMIPAFCPKESIIHRQFGPKNGSNALRVTGSADTAWDDNLAKFSVGRDCQPLNIICLERSFAVLTAEGTVILWNSETCEEMERFVHGEAVLTFRFSSNGDKLATYGFRTTKIWIVSTGTLVESILNPDSTKALDLAFTADDTTLITCSEDRIIRQFSTTMSEDGWEELPGDSEFSDSHFNSPNCVAFNPEGTQVAIAYRSFPLSVWGVDYPGLIGRCERPDDSGVNSSWSGVDRVCWNPVTGHVIGIYNDGTVFKWHPVDGENEELKTVALEARCSPDGNLLVTSDADGTLQIWSFHHFALIYQLSCTSPVTDLAIDPEGRRIYDLRETFCNIWEPNALIRLAEADEKASDAASTVANSAHMSLAEASAEMLEPITALALSPQTAAYCAGSDDGTITLSKKGAAEPTELSQTFMTIEHIIWSEDEKTLATADLSGRVTVKSVDLANAEVADKALLSTTIEDSIRQLLLSPKLNHLLVSTYQSVTIWSLGDSGRPIATKVFQNNTRRWANHPQCPDLLISYGFSDIQLWKWSDLSKVRSTSLERTIPMSAHSTPDFRAASAALFSPRQSENSVDKTFVTHDKSMTLVQTSRAVNERRRKKDFLLVKTGDIVAGDTNGTSEGGLAACIPGNPLPPEIHTRIEMPLGFVSSDTTKPSWSGGPTHSNSHNSSSSAILAFIDRDFWVCTGNVAASGQANVKKHFFLPRDWLNLECLELAVMTKDGTLLVPKNGEVAAVKGGLREEWPG